MRRRSNTIYADSVEEYIRTAQLESSYPYSCRDNSPKRSSKQASLQAKLDNSASSSKTNALSSANLGFAEPERFSSNEKSNESEDDWASFDFDCEEPFSHHIQKEGEEDLMIPSLTFSSNTADTDYSEDAEETRERQPIVKKVMVIGLDGSGKHSLINTAFECGQSKLENHKQVMDLLMKTERDEDDLSETRYQFWIRTLQSEGPTNETLENLIKIYYKSVSLFVFVYSIDDKKSLECLTNTIQSVKDVVGEEKFTGVLLGNKCDLEANREVSFFEGLALQEKYKLTFFIETNYVEKSLKGRLIELLHEVEGVGELKSRKRSSILSME